MQDKATSPGKINRPEKNPLDAKTTYHIGNRSFVVEPVFKEESPLRGQRRSIRQTDTFLFVPSHTAGAP